MSWNQRPLPERRCSSCQAPLLQRTERDERERERERQESGTEKERKRERERERAGKSSGF